MLKTLDLGTHLIVQLTDGYIPMLRGRELAFAKGKSVGVALLPDHEYDYMVRVPNLSEQVAATMVDYINGGDGSRPIPTKYYKDYSSDYELYDYESAIPSLNTRLIANGFTNLENCHAIKIKK